MVIVNYLGGKDCATAADSFTHLRRDCGDLHPSLETITQPCMGRPVMSNGRA
jgi:hypothetical protein